MACGAVEPSHCGCELARFCRELARRRGCYYRCAGPRRIVILPVDLFRDFPDPCSDTVSLFGGISRAIALVVLCAQPSLMRVFSGMGLEEVLSSGIRRRQWSQSPLSEKQNTESRRYCENNTGHAVMPGKLRGLQRTRLSGRALVFSCWYDPPGSRPALAIASVPASSLT